jgi:hypothetical protein
MWSETANLAVESGADLVVAGSGGDDIVDYDQLLIDRLATGSMTGRFRDAKVAASASPGRFARALTQGVKDAIPSGAKTLIRATLYRRGESADTLIRRELWDAIESQPHVMAPFDFDFPMLTQTAAVAAAVHPSVAWFNELQGAQYASTGIDLSHPYFDRQLIEFVASLPPRAHPFEGSTKPLTRRAFADHLPESVLTRHTKTVADDYLDHIFVIHADAGIANRKSFCCLVESNVDSRFKLISFEGIIGKGQQLELVKSVRGVGYKLAQKNFLVRIQGMDN